MKTFKQAVAFLLVVCMLTTGNMSFFASAAEGDSVNTENSNTEYEWKDPVGVGNGLFYRIFHLDAARKYFKVEEIKEAITIAANAGYNQVELYLSDNQGFRLALDDMIVKTDSKEYDLTDALGAGYSAGPHYTDDKDIWLTQSDMDYLIQYANSLGVGIVPCINAPGHMGTILKYLVDEKIVNQTEFCYTSKSGLTSQSALNLDNDEAYAFGLALINKYAEYFASRGVKYFNMGADEYAADLANLSTGENNGMDLLYNEGGYLNFVDFINDAAGIIERHKMVPRAYNDCIYYTGKDTYNGKSVTFDTDIEICYWNAKWDWEDVLDVWFRRADASYLASKGHKMINTNGNCYYVVGASDDYTVTQEKMDAFNYKVFHKNDTIENVAGAMFCVWCDDARDKTATTKQIIDGATPWLKQFAQKLPAMETITIQANQSYEHSESISGTHSASTIDSSIASVTVSHTTGEGGYQLGDYYMDFLINGSYFLTDGKGLFLVAQDGELKVVNKEAAKPWDIQIDTKNESEGWVKTSYVKQGGYYLGGYKASDGLPYIKVGTSIPDTPIYFDIDTDNATQIYWGKDWFLFWNGETLSDENTEINSDYTYFYPYVATYVASTAATKLTFHGHKEGITYASVNGKDYKIVVEGPELPTQNVDVKVGETTVLTVNGNVVGDYATKHPTIATIKTSLDDGLVVSDLITAPITNGQYYIGNGTAYLIEKDGDWAMVNAAEAKPWNVTVDSATGQVTITQGDYYLSSVPNNRGTFDVKILNTAPEYPFYMDATENNAIYLKYTYYDTEENYYIYWNTDQVDHPYIGAKRTTELKLFCPYQVDTINTPATNLVFEGQRVGQTEVAIGGIRYLINVVPGNVDEVVHVTVGDTHVWPETLLGNFSGDHLTDHTNIATVTTTVSSETIYNVGDVVTGGKTTGYYYLGDSSGRYLVVEDGALAVADKANARPWYISVLGTGATIEQDGYYLGNTVSGTEITVSINNAHTVNKPFYFKGSNSNALSVTIDQTVYYMKWVLGNPSAIGGTTTEAEGFHLYYAVPETCYNTTVTFHGHEEGTTYVTIGNVRYQINVVMREEVINLQEGLSETIEVSGNVSGEYETEDKKIASVTTSSTVDKSVGSEVTGVVSVGEYYIGAQGKYLVVKDGKFAMVSKEEAIPWTVDIDSTGATFIKQGEYYLSNIADGNGGYNIEPLTTAPQYTMKFDGTGDLYVMSLTFDEGRWYFLTWTDESGGYIKTEIGSAANSATYFSPYIVDNTETSGTEITFHGNKVGTTYVTIGGVRYQINVTENENIEKKIINLKVGQILELPAVSGDVSGVYWTDNPSIAAVTTMLVDGATLTSVGSLFTDAMINGSYYLGYDKQYVIVEDGQFRIVDAEHAKPWEVIVTSSGTATDGLVSRVTIMQDGYYFGNQVAEDGSVSIVPLTSAPTDPMRFDRDNDLHAYVSETRYYTMLGDNNTIQNKTHAENDDTPYLQPYVVNKVTTTSGTALTFYGYEVGVTYVTIGGVKYEIHVTEEDAEVIELTIPLGSSVVVKHPANLTGQTIDDAYVDVDFEYRRQDIANWVADPQVGSSYHIMGIENHYLVVVNGKLKTTETPTEDQKWTVVENGDGYSLKYGGYYLVNHWHDGVMTLEILTEDTSVFPWQFSSNQGIYCTDKAYVYRLAHNPITHEWELSDITTRRIGFAEVQINDNTYATELTFIGKQVGETEITIGKKTYKITVTPESAPDMESVSIEYWITNNTCVDTDDTSSETYGNGSYLIGHDHEGLRTETGLMIKDLVAKTAARKNADNEIETDKLVFWKASVNMDGYWQQYGLESRAMSGTFFDRIRLWNGQWGVSGDGVAWRVLESTDQLVAYYIQETDVTDEVITYAMDWGHVNATDATDGYKCVYDYADYSYVLLDFAVKYESGDRTPDEFPNSKTIGYHCTHNDVANAVHQDADGNYYRVLGVIQAEATEGFEVYMVTLTPNTDNKSSMLSTTGTNPIGVTYNYDNATEKVVWVDDEANLGEFADESLHADGYHVGGTAYVPEISIYEHQAMLVTYYVRVVEQESAIEVHYHDASGLDTTNLTALKDAPEFHKYNISVKGDTTFSADIDIDANGNLINATVINSLGKLQTVTTDLSTLPTIPVQYKYGKYEIVECSLSEDKKQLHLYYTSEDPIYVVDFGLSVNIELGLSKNATAEIQAKPTYGTAAIKDGKLVYTPTKVLTTIDSVVVKITETGTTDKAIKTYKFYPATTVYYEEGFISIKDSSWSGAGTAVSNTNKQANTLIGEEDFNYGYDVHYSSQQAGPSNGTYLVSTDPSGYAEFTFTGTGVDIYANCDTDSGSINVVVRNSAGKPVKMLQINTKMASEGSATAGQAVTAYNIPVASIDFKTTHDTYTVQIRHIKTRVDGAVVSSPVQIDGFRVYNTLKDSSVFKGDGEANPTFMEMRDVILGGFGIDSIKEAVTELGSDYFSAEELATALKTQVLDKSQSDEEIVTGTAIIIDTKQDHDNAYVQDLLDNGPKNEVYLFSGQSIVFKPAEGIDVQLGLKAINTNVSYTIVKNTNGTEISDEAKAITTSTDMFYQLGTMDGNTVITITNNSENDGILAITDFKWMKTDVTAEAQTMPLLTLEEDDYASAFGAMGFEPENPPIVDSDTILYQVNKNNSDIRLIAYVDSLEKYSSVTFTLTIGGNTSKELVCTTAYSGLYASGSLYTTENIYGKSGYFTCYTIQDYLEFYAGQEVTLTVTYKTVTGDSIVSTRTVTIE